MFAISMETVILCLLALTASCVVVKGEDQAIEECIIFGQHRKDLSYHNLTTVPKGLLNDTQYLDLSHNSISGLYRGDLTGLPQLCFLKITHNRLQHVSPSAFTNSVRLKVLNISCNSLMTIPDLPLPQLRVLDISGNLYSSYRLGKSFENLKHLRDLWLGSVSSRAVNASDFAPLRNRSLRWLAVGGGNALHSYEPGSFAQLKSLEVMTLKLSFCRQFEMFKTILTDLGRIKTKKIDLVKFLPHFCEVSIDPFESLGQMPFLTNVTFVDSWMNSSVMTKLLKNIFLSQIQEIAFVNITYNQDTPEGIQFFGVPGHNGTVSLKSVIFDGVHHYQYNYPKINISVSYLRHMTNLKFSGTGMNISPCNLMSALPTLEVLDLSNNLLTNGGFWWSGCSYTKVFPALKWLSLSHNKFDSLAFISRKTREMNFLESLDLSFNAVTLSEESCLWPTHLTQLSLSNNNLGNQVFQCLSPHFQRIDLSKTGITAITGEALWSLPSLSELYLSLNSIHTLPDHLQAPHLHTLYVDENAITSLGQSSLQGLPALRALRAGGNPFSCTCDSYWFLTTFNKSLLSDWPVSYRCSNPPAFAGLWLEDYKPGVLACRPWLQAVTVLSVVIVIAAVFGFTFHACDGAWYTKMLWVWITVKRRGYQEAHRLQEVSFRHHAFVSYSHQDAPWVNTELVPSLEASGLSLCVHDRDFVPGEWILDNIINCVEQSYRTLFVLSRSFVESSWCVYELFFAQHRSLSARQDSLVFVLLEPIPADSIPRKFLKLRSLLRQQTYLEWPQDERKRQVFWASLKALLHTADSRVGPRSPAAPISETSPLLAHSDCAGHYL
ncbi:toll-like receptor 2 [Conger conger]|uniref:toll-like receptor 2 n=1 Tax=Conger conger TaxID=82655 RepID=UPI002A5AAF15|nr:toll-like receptor 2 [Conger conger]